MTLPVVSTGGHDTNCKSIFKAATLRRRGFPKDFMFELTKEEFHNWRSQIVISKADKMGLNQPLMAFTEQGVAWK